VRLLDHEIVKVLQHVGALVRPRAEPGRHVLEQRLLAQVEADHLRHVGIDRLVVRDPRADGVRERHVARAIGLEEPGHAQHRVGPEHLGIQVVVVDAPVDDVDPPRPAGRPHVDDAVAHEEIGALDQLHPHLVGEEGVLVIGAVEGARRQHDHRRRAVAALRRDRDQAVQQLLGIVGDRRDPVAGAEVREQAQHGLPVLEHVGDARGRAAVVLEHVEPPGIDPDHVDAGDMGVDAARRREAHHLGPEALVAGHEFLGDAARAQDLAPVVDVGEEGVQRLDALLEPARELPPLEMVEHAGHDVEGDQPLGVAALRIHGEGDADAPEQHLRLAALQHQRPGRCPGKPVGHLPIGGPDATAAVVHLVEGPNRHDPSRSCAHSKRA
jgi:hypothetical protein